jgi:hypothetical protein
MAQSLLVRCVVDLLWTLNNKSTAIPQQIQQVEFELVPAVRSGVGTNRPSQTSVWRLYGPSVRGRNCNENVAWFVRFVMQNAEKCSPFEFVAVPVFVASGCGQTCNVGRLTSYTAMTA